MIAGVVEGAVITIIHVSWGWREYLRFEQCACFLHLVETTEMFVLNPSCIE